MSGNTYKAELSVVAAKAMQLIRAAIDDEDEAAFVIASIIANFAREGEGPQFTAAAPFIVTVSHLLAEMKVAADHGHVKIITMKALNQ